MVQKAHLAQRRQEMTQSLLVDQLIEEGCLKTPSIIDAFKKIDRAKFVPEELKESAYLNIPLSIGKGQTISQPATVAFMLELLQPKEGEKILDIGFGSGWLTAILAEIVATSSRRGEVLAVEIIPEIFEWGKKNIEQFTFTNIRFFLGNALISMGKEMPFDKIIVSAAGQDIPQSWKSQLKIGGRLVLPVNNSLWLVIRKSEKEFTEQEFSSFVFVPLIEL